MKKYTYSDVEKGLETATNGDVGVTYDVETIIQSIKTILSTIPYERVRNPIGSRLVTYLFEPISSDTTDEIRTEIGRSLREYEPRVIIQGVRVTPNPDKMTYDVSIDAFIKKLNYNERIDISLKILGDESF